MSRTLARSRALPLLIAAAVAISPALVSTSAEAAAKEPYRVGIKLSDGNVTVDETVRVSGKVRPLTTGKVKLQRRASGKWKTLKQVKLVASSYATTVSFDEPGVAALRVVAPKSNGNKKGTSKVRNVRILTHAKNPQIATQALPSGAVGVPYSATVSTADGRPGTWSIGAGALPPGLSIARATGVISGTPTAAGTSEVGVYFKDSDGRVAARVFDLVISANDGPVITTTTLAGASVGEVYSATVQTADNRAGTWSITTGTLPAGLTLAPATGVISGTPTTAGTSAFTIQFKDAADRTATKPLSIVVSDVEQLIVTASLPNGVKGTAYSATLQSKDNRPGTWSITAGALPAGLTLAPATGVISGTPTTAGKADFTVRFQDTNSNASTRALSITIAQPPPVISTESLPKGRTGQAYTATLMTADNRPGTWSIATGTLPAGLTLAPATGVISGTPTTRGTSNFTVKFTDTDNVEVTKPLSIQVQTCILLVCF